MSAAAQIWVELSARDTGFNAFLERMDKKLSTVGGTAEQVWMNSRTAAEKYLATLREIERLNTTVDIKSQKTFISDDTAERARIEARRNAASAVGVDESSWERYQRQLQELADAHQEVGFSVEELRRAQARFREEYQNANPIFAQAERLMRSNATAAENYARQLAEISRLETTRNPLTGQNFVDGDTATRAHQAAQRRLVEGLGGEYENYLERFSRRQQEVQALFDAGAITAQQYRSVLRDIMEEYSRASPAAQQFNAELAEERALLGSLTPPIERYNQQIAVLQRALTRGAITQDQFNDRQTILRTNMEVNQRQWEAGKNGIGNYSNAAIQASYAIQDFVQVSNQGMGASLRATANNISQLAMQFGGLKGAVAGAALTVGAIWIANWFDAQEKIKGGRSEVDKLKDSFDRLRESIKGVAEDVGFGFDVDNARGGELFGMKKRNERDLAVNDAEIRETKRVIGDVEQKRDVLKRALKPDADQIKEANEELRKLREELRKLETEQRRLQFRRDFLLPDAIRQRGGAPPDLPQDRGPIERIEGELPRENFNDIRAGRFKHAQAATKKAAEELADAAREKMFAGRPGGDKMAKILEDLDKGQKNVVAGMQGQDRVNGLTAVQDAANAQLDALQRQLQTGLDSRDARQQKAAFLGAEEFSKQIQTGAIETKAEKAQRETANNTKKMIEEIVKTRESIEKSKGAVFGGK